VGCRRSPSWQDADATAAALGGLDSATWTRSPERRVLLDYARALLLAQGADPADITRRPFEACLSACRYLGLSKSAQPKGENHESAGLR